MDYFKRLLSCLSSSGPCTSIIHSVTSFVFLRHCYVTFLLKNFWWLSIHSQGIKSTFLSLSQDPPNAHSNLIQFIFPQLFSMAPFHMLYFPANSFFPCLLLIIHVTYTSIHVYFSQSSLLSTNLHAPVIFPLKSQSKRNLPPQDFSADQVLSPSSEAPNLLRGHMSIAFLNCNYLCT